MIVTGGLGGRSVLVTGGYGIVTSTEVEVSESTRQYVVATNEHRPLVGSKAERLDETDFDIKGFHYDRKRYVDQDDIRTYNPGVIGNVTDGVSDGTVLDYWQSGIGAGDDADVVDIVSHLKDDERKWSPRVHQGEYFSYLDNYYLFGDGHVVHPLITEFVDWDITTQYVELEYTPDSDSPIAAGIYRRESDYSAFPWRFAELVGSFTGEIIEAGTRESTLDSDGYPDYSKVDDFLRWEIYYHQDTNRLYFNKNMASLVGKITNINDPESELEELGSSDGIGGQFFYTRYFPVDPGIRGSSRVEKHMLYVDDEAWSVADDNDLSFHSASDKVYRIDYDLGMIEFGGRSIDAVLHLAEDIGATDTVITLLGDIDALPAKGVLLIDSEKVAYHGRTDTELVQVVRGYDGTTATVHSQHASVSYVAPGMIPASGSVVRMGYYTTPRIEYAIDKSVDVVVADDINAKPSTVPEGNGIVYISRVPLSLASLTLEVDKPLISGTIYGPLNLGADYALLVATALSPSGEPVPRLPITIEESSAPPFIGLLNGAPSDYSSVSNYSGEITSSYTVGSDLSSILVNAVTAIQASSQTLVTLSGDHTDVELDDVYIYVITKDDPAQGTVGVLATYDSGSLSTSDLIAGSNQKLTVTTLKDYPTITVSDVYPDDVFNGGTVTIYLTSGTSVEGTIRYWRDGMIYIAESLPISDGDIDFVVLNKSDWLEWNPSTLNGKARVLYEYNSNAVNPVTGSLGAYFPIQPSSRSYDSVSNQTTFVFDELLPSPDPALVTNNVGGYMLTIPRVIEFRAKAYDPLTGRLVLSNTIELKVFLPDYMNGVYLSTSGKIPYGFRLPDESSDAASGLDGANFVSINPVAGSTGAIANPFGSLIHLIST